MLVSFENIAHCDTSSGRVWQLEGDVWATAAQQARGLHPSNVMFYITDMDLGAKMERLLRNTAPRVMDVACDDTTAWKHPKLPVQLLTEVSRPTAFGPLNGSGFAVVHPCGNMDQVSVCEVSLHELDDWTLASSEVFLFKADATDVMYELVRAHDFSVID